MNRKPPLKGRRIWDPPEREIYSSGHLACPGCGAAMSARLALKVLGPRTVMVVPACCFAVIDAPFPFSAAGVPLLHCAFESAGATASGVRAALDVRGVEGVTVVAWAGDGGTYDIGLQALSAAAERNEDMIYVCYDNEAYMNTGAQRSSATPAGAWTTTTPAYPGKAERKKDLDEIVIAHRIPYFATACVSYLDDFMAKFRRARDARGFRFLRLFSPCSPGWKCAESDTVDLGYLAVRSRVFPLLEVEDGGARRRITRDPAPIPIGPYLEKQGRFKHLEAEDVARMQAQVDERWKDLCRRYERPAAEPAEVVRAERGPLPGIDEFRRLLGERSLALSDAEAAHAYEILRAAWASRQYAAMSDDEVIGQAIIQIQLLGSV